MIRPNDFLPTNREDDLLKRLKQCVGSLQTASKDNKRISSSGEQDSFPSKQLISHEIPNQRKYDSRSSYRQSFGNKQNLTDKKYHTRQQDFRKLNADKENSDFLKITKNYLQNNRQNVRPYRTDRKQSLPLTQISNSSYTKKELFPKQVSESTKKRIAERQFLINGQNDKIVPNRLSQKSKNRSFNEDQFLQRLSLRKNSYSNQSHPRKETYSESMRNAQKISIIRNAQIFTKENNSCQQDGISKNFSTEERPQQKSEVLTLPKYENYSKIAMENLVKDQDLRKTEKMQKLKKITSMNQEINKKIRKIVDTFENYLTHRQI